MQTIPYDLVLMDVQMPVVDGLEATRKIRSLEDDKAYNNQNKQIPIIAMTAHAMQGDRDRCIEAGMNDYVTKPINPQSLATVLGKWLPKNKKEPESIELNDLNNITKPAASSLITNKKEEIIKVFDKAGVMEILMHDNDLATMMFQVFLEDIPNQIKLLKDCIDLDDSKTAERQAHTIRGACANIGGESMRACANKIEKLAKAKNLGAVKESIPELEVEFEFLEQELIKEM